MLYRVMGYIFIMALIIRTIAVGPGSGRMFLEHVFADLSPPLLPLILDKLNIHTLQKLEYG